MTDEELVRVLQRYRPAGPPAHLRTRIVIGSSPAAAQIWPWASAAAALLLGSLWLSASASAQIRRADVSPPDPMAAEIEQLTAILGDTDEARLIAEAIAMNERARVAKSLSADVAVEFR